MAPKKKNTLTKEAQPLEGVNALAGVLETNTSIKVKWLILNDKKIAGDKCLSIILPCIRSKNSKLNEQGV